MRMRDLGLALFIMAALLTVPAQSTPTGAHDVKGGKSPVTTSSKAAARYFETGMVHYENHRWNFALRDWREKVALAPKFSPACTCRCFPTSPTRPARVDRARAHSTV